MNKLECYVIGDLLPLYIDNACSEQTSKDVEAHLETCEKCKKLYGEMKLDVSPALHTPEFESKKLFKHVCRNVIGIIIALAAIISCFVINLSAAWEGGPAAIGNLIVTILYVVFWGAFSVFSRKYVPLINTSFVMSLITLVASLTGLIAQLSGGAGFITALLGTFSAVPFYGLRYFMEWVGLYATASVLSLGWLVCTLLMKRRNKHTFSTEKVLN